jgi:hypothetical protein
MFVAILLYETVVFLPAQLICNFVIKPSVLADLFDTIDEIEPLVVSLFHLSLFIFSNQE